MKPSNLNRRDMIAGSASLALLAVSTRPQDTLLERLFGRSSRTTPAPSAPAIGQADAAAGIREALTKGVRVAIDQVGRENGFFGDNLIRIPLPKSLETLQKSLSGIGMSGTLDELERKLNRGAEKAVPVGKELFLNAVRTLTVEDAVTIVQGPSNSATLYLKRRTTPELTPLFRPIMADALSSTGALRLYDQAVSRVRTVPLGGLGASGKDALIDHGVDGALDGIFTYIGKQEAAIRENPAERTTDILKRVFG